MRLCILPVLLVACVVARAADPAPPVTVDSLDEAQVQKAIDTLQSNSLSPELFDSAERQRALLDGLLKKIGKGASLSLTADIKKDPPAFVAEILGSRAGYIRPGALDADTLKQIDASLQTFTDKGVPAVILDLRDVSPGTDFDMAAEFARRFCPKGRIVFTIEKPASKQERIMTADRDPLFKGTLVVLTAAGNAGAVEALASSLRAGARAMVVGAPTAGGAAEYADFPIGGGKSLRVAVSRISVPGEGPVFPAGVKPDIEVSMDPATERKILDLGHQNGVARFVFEKERPRMNEAALMVNENPEIGEAHEKAEEDLKDLTLQRAIDLITAISFLNKRTH